jgi:hypothetical protein
MAAVNFQKQTARNLVLSAGSQVAYGGVLADAKLTRRASVDASTVFTNSTKSYSDQGAVGHGTDFATAYVITGFNTMATMKGMGAVDSWLLGWMLAFICGQEVASGMGPYTHAFSIPNLSSLAPCTTCYVEETADVHRKYTDMAAKTLSIDVPERGPLQATLDMVGTGNFVPGSMAGPLPAVPALNYLLGSDIIATFTPLGGAATPMNGRQTGISIKIDRNSAPFESSGDGLRAGSVQYGKFGLSVDMTIMAEATDDVNGWFENGTPLALTLATNPANTYQFSISFPMAIIKANKLGNKSDLVAWQLSFDQSSVLQVGNTAAFSAQVINECAAYLIPA